MQCTLIKQELIFEPSKSNLCHISTNPLFNEPTEIGQSLDFRKSHPTLLVSYHMYLSFFYSHYKHKPLYVQPLAPGQRIAFIVIVLMECVNGQIQKSRVSETVNIHTSEIDNLLIKKLSFLVSGWLKYVVLISQLIWVRFHSIILSSSSYFGHQNNL